MKTKNVKLYCFLKDCFCNPLHYYWEKEPQEAEKQLYIFWVTIYRQVGHVKCYRKLACCNFLEQWYNNWLHPEKL